MTAFNLLFFLGNSATNYGTLNEPKARKLYMDCTGHDVINLGFLVNPNMPWFGYSPDGFIENDKIIEIKCPIDGQKMAVIDLIYNVPCLEKKKTSGNNQKDSEVTILMSRETGNNSMVAMTLGNIVGLKENHPYFFQVQMGMFICNVKKCDFIIYSSFEDSAVVIPIAYNEKKVDEYLGKLQYVYFKHILPRLVLD